MATMQEKMAAALAAVNVYLQTEDNDAASRHPANTLQSPALQQNAWCQSGRQDMMMMRKLMQLRTFAHLR